MYQFTSKEQEERFNKTLEECVVEFSKQSRIKKQRAINAVKRAFMESRNEYKKGAAWKDAEFFENFSFYDMLNYKWFWWIVREEYFEPTLEELDSFRQ